MSTIPTSLSGPELRRLMRKHHCTIKALAFRLGLPEKRIRKAREFGLNDGYALRDWTEAITGDDPGPLPEKYIVSRHIEETFCGDCGCPLFVNDVAFEYAGEIFCSCHCARRSRGWK